MPNDLSPSTANSSLLEGSHHQPDIEFASYQQSPPASARTSTVFTEEEAERASYSWRLADFDAIPDRSRDGSIHATDEVFNAASHLSAAMLSTLGTVLLVAQSSVQGNPWKIVSFSLYGASLIFLFACSALHHSVVGSPKVERFLRMMDYLAIYPLIFGTFTPLCLVFYHDSAIGWAFIGVVWGISILGMLGTACFFVQIPKWLSMTMYITLGWIGGCMTYWLLQVLGWQGFGLFFLGGVCYTGGGYIYTTEQPNPIPGRFGFHELWHIAVIAGALSHYCLMYFYVLPWEPGRQPGHWN